MSERWSLTEEEEGQYRRGLFKKAMKGDSRATQELARVYGVRVWTEHERASLVYVNPKYKESKGAGKSAKTRSGRRPQ